MKHSTAQDITYIDYIDTLPGVGKTHWMMDQLEAFIVAHLSGEAKEKGLPHTYIYAAPTHAILHEQSMALAQRFAPPNVARKMFLKDEKIANDESVPEEARERARERQRRLLDASKYSAEMRTRALRLITHWHENKLRMSPVPVLAAKELPVFEGKPAWRRGTVLFMTHEAFVNLPYNEDPESDASLRTRCIGVFFDEARQVLDRAVDKGTRLPSALLYQLFKGKPCKSADGGDTRTFRLCLRQNLSPAEMRDTLTPFFTVLSDRQRAAVNSLYTALKNPRYEVYAELPKSVTDEFKALRSGEIQKNGTTKAHPFLRVLLPSHLFDGYHSVLLASAWLSSSQMFHLLKQASVAGDGSRKIKLRNVTDKLHSYVGKHEKIPRYELIRKRLSRVTILPLISNREVTHEMVKDGRLEDAANDNLTPLSKNRLNQMLVTEEGRRRLFQLREKIPDSEQEIVRAYTRSSPFERYRYYVQFSDGDERLNMPRAVRRIMALESEGHLYSNPLLYMARTALHLARHWDSGGRQDTSEYLDPIVPLMVVNKAYADFIRNSCIFPDAKRRKMEAVDDDLSYSTFGNNVTFMSSYSHGLNCYQDKTCVAFLSAIQPEPSFARLLSMRLGPDYDYQKDYLISTCAQAVARTAMRDAKSREPVLVMVPDTFTAKALASHFDNYPIVQPPADLEDAEYDLSLSFADVSRILFSNTSPKHLPKDEYLAHKEEHAVYRKQIVKKAVSSYQMRMVDAIGEEGAKRLSYVRTRIWMLNKKFGIFNNDHPKLKAFIEERDSLLTKYKAYKKEHGLSKEEYAVHRKQIVKKAVKSYQERVASVIGEDGAKRLQSIRPAISRLTERLENDSSDKATRIKLKKLTAERDALLAAYKEAKAKAKHTAKEL